MSSFDDDLDAQLEVMQTDRDWADCKVTVNNKLVRLRFTQMDALAWADVVDQCPVRPTSPIDLKWGFNFRAATVLAAPLSGKRLEGDEQVAMTVEQWQKLFKGISPFGLRSIGDAIFSLNEWIPAQEIAEAKKAFAAESDESSNSPASSESPALD